MTGQLVFFETRGEVLWAERSLPRAASDRWVALTAEALQALEERELPHDPACRFADARRLAPTEEKFNIESVALAREIEDYIAERYPPARFDGPGFLSGQGYHIQYTISAIATRAFLMRETIERLAPRQVVAFAVASDAWFSRDGYVHGPWLVPVSRYAAEAGIDFEVLDEPKSLSIEANMSRIASFAQRVRASTRRRLYALGVKPVVLPASSLGLRLLMVDSLAYDWAPVLESLRKSGKDEVFTLASRRWDDRVWGSWYLPALDSITGGERRVLDCGPLRPELTEVETLKALFDDWTRSRGPHAKLEVLGMDLLAALSPQLREMASMGPPLARHADAVAERALDLAHPGALGFFAMAWLSAKRLAYAARKRGIPSICYQHGGVYGTHLSPKNEQIELAHADLFLTYGEGVVPRQEPAFPSRARHVPVGSTRLERVLDQSSPPAAGKRAKILWIAETSSRNTVGGTFQVEDTERYLLQREALGLLAGSGKVDVLFRPYPGEAGIDGTSRWVSTHASASLRSDLVKPLSDLIRWSEIVISDASSNTVWNEVLAARRPLLLYCDPRQTLLTAEFMANLSAAVTWGRTKEEFLALVSQLSEVGRLTSSRLEHEGASFLRKYATHEGHCVERVLRVLEETCPLSPESPG